MADPAAAGPVAGVNWATMLGGASFFTLLGVIVRQWVPMRKVRMEELAQARAADAQDFQRLIDAQQGEITRMGERIDRLEKALDAQRERYEATLAYERASHEAEISLQRHATRNAKQVLIGVLDLIEAAPENAQSHAAKMRKRMTELDLAEQAEAAAIRGAKIVAASPKAEPAA